jgi:hypothetical protein
MTFAQRAGRSASGTSVVDIGILIEFVDLALRARFAGGGCMFQNCRSAAAPQLENG